jgi:hypothetical protein
VQNSGHLVLTKFNSFGKDISNEEVPQTEDQVKMEIHELIRLIENRELEQYLGELAKSQDFINSYKSVRIP